MKKDKAAEKGHLKTGGKILHTKESSDRGRERQHRAVKVNKVMRELKTPPLNWGS